MRRAVALCLVLGCASPADAAPPDDAFWKLWGDGKAEVTGYALTEPRYGKPRSGTLVLVFVTEDFSDSARVKADPGKHPASDVYPVMKINDTRLFETGIYRYRVMTSSFFKTEAAFSLVKISHSMQEWCGHVYAQWLAHGDKLDGVSHSYFDGEADQTRELPLPPGGLTEESLPLVVRGLRGDWLAPGSSKTVPFLSSLMRARFAHKPQAWSEATLGRAAPAPCGKNALRATQCTVWTLVEKSGVQTRYTVEVAAPHRLLGWSSSSGEEATALGQARLPYWTLNGPGGEAALKQLGLLPLQPHLAP